MIRKKVKCIDCGMFVLHRDTNDYSEMYSWVRRKMETDGYLAHREEGMPVCYLNVYDMPESIGESHLLSERQVAWFEVAPITTLRRCRKFMPHLPGRMPWDLLKTKHLAGHGRVQRTIMIAVLTTALATAILAGLAIYASLSVSRSAAV